jgi:hypothetical protein
MTKAEARAFYNEWKYYQVLNPQGKLEHPCYMTEEIVARKRTEGYKVRLARDWDKPFM